MVDWGDPVYLESTELSRVNRVVPNETIEHFISKFQSDKIDWIYLRNFQRKWRLFLVFEPNWEKNRHLLNNSWPSHFEFWILEKLNESLFIQLKLFDNLCER
jgi:hypothetical protein